MVYAYGLGQGKAKMVHMSHQLLLIVCTFIALYACTSPTPHPIRASRVDVATLSILGVNLNR